MIELDNKNSQQWGQEQKQQGDDHDVEDEQEEEAELVNLQLY